MDPITKLLGVAPPNTPTLTEEEVQALQGTRTEREWEREVDLILTARAGQWPPDWYLRVILSGVAAVCQRRWGRTRPRV